MWFLSPFGWRDISPSRHDQAVKKFEVFRDLIGRAIAVWENNWDSPCLLNSFNIRVVGETGNSDKRGVELLLCSGGRNPIRVEACVLTDKEADANRSNN